MTEFNELVGKTLTVVKNHDNEEIRFATECGRMFRMYHDQDCCETVTVEDIVGDLEDLIGSPVLVAGEFSQEDPNADESGTWTFYKIATVKGWVDIRWYGSSNGYYSESVSFEEVAPS